MTFIMQIHYDLLLKDCLPRTQENYRLESDNLEHDDARSSKLFERIKSFK